MLSKFFSKARVSVGMWGMGLLVACQTPEAPLPPVEAVSAKPLSSVSSQRVSGASTTPTPVPRATGTKKPFWESWENDCLICDIGRENVYIKVFDDSFQPLVGAHVSLRSLNSSVAFETEGLTAEEGLVVLEQVPAGIQIEILATAPGYTPRRRVEVIKSGKSDPYMNHYYFGTDGGGNYLGVDYNALSDKPEVTMAIPSRRAAAIEATTPFVLRFSEPMDRQSVLRNFVIRAHAPRRFSVDGPLPTVVGSEKTEEPTGTLIYDAQAFDARWNAEDTELTLSFKQGLQLPTDTARPLTAYQVSLNRQDAVIQDKAGTARTEKPFKITDGIFEASYFFTVQADRTPPVLQQVTTHAAHAAIEHNTLRLHFSEPMHLQTQGPHVVGGLNFLETQAPAGHQQVPAQVAAANYRVTLQRQGRVVFDAIPWSQLGGMAHFDPEHSDVVILDAPLQPTLYTVVGSPSPGAVQGTLYSADGGRASFRLSLREPTYGALQSALNQLTAEASFAVKEVRNVGGARGLGVIEAGDQYQVTLAPGARSAQAPHLPLLYVEIPRQGLVGRTLFDTAWAIVPTQSHLSAFARFQAGDQITVQAALTLVDPAGNALSPQGAQISTFVP